MGSLLIVQMGYLNLGYSSSANAQVGSSTSVFENFDGSQVPRIFARLSCYVVQFGIIMAGIAMILSGIIFLLSRGNPVALTGAKKTFTYALLGALIIYGVYTIILSISLFVIGSTNLPWVPLSCS